MRTVQTGPWPVQHLLYQSCSNRIAENISDHGQEMAVLLNGKALKSPLPDMSMAPVMFVISSDVARHPPLHECTHRCTFSWLYNQMKMIGHETDGQHFHGEFGFRFGEKV